MSMRAAAELTTTQEGYLEVIAELIHNLGAARVKDIAERMEVAKSSVTVALRGLAKRDLVRYEPYRLVSLSGRGKALAERMEVRHQVLRRFFTDVLDVDEQIADANACRIEHAVGDGIMRRLSCFVEFMFSTTVPARDLPKAFWQQCRDRRHSGQCEGCNVAADHGQDGTGRDDRLTLADIQPGQKAKIVRVTGPAATNSRLMEMGVTPGTVVSVVRVAPLGDPVEVKVRGYSLSLRREEARGIEVERA